MKRLYQDIVVLVLLAIPLRVYKLTEPLVYAQNDTLYFTSSQRLLELLSTPWTEPHPPLYYIFTFVSRQLFGSSHFALRFPSIIAGILTVLALYLLGRELKSRRTGLYAGLIATVAPFLLTHSRIARMYAQLGFFTVLAFWLFVRLHKRGFSVKLGIAYTLSLVAAFYTHLFGAFVWLSHVVLLGVWTYADLTEFKTSDGYSWQAIRPWVYSFVSSALLMLPWIAVLYVRISQGGGAGPGPALSVDSLIAIPGSWWDYYHYVRGDLPARPIRLLGAVMLVSIFIITGGRALTTDSAQYRLDARDAPLLLVWLGVPICILLGTSLLLSRDFVAVRWFMMAATGFYFLIAVGISKLSQNSVQVGAVVIVLVAFAGTSAGGVLIDSSAQWQETVDHVDSEAEPSDLVVAGRLKSPGEFEYYSDRSDISTVGIENSTSLNRLCTAIDGKDRVWVVGSRPHISSIADRFERSDVFHRSDQPEFRGMTIALFTKSPSSNPEFCTNG